MITVSQNKWTQKCFERAVEKMGLGNVFEALCNYICEEDLREFIGYYCDNHNCFPEEDE